MADVDGELVAGFLYGLIVGTTTGITIAAAVVFGGWRQIFKRNVKR